MKIDISPTAEDAATAAARLMAEHIMAAAAARGHACVAISGGHTPWSMLEKLSSRGLPWARLHIFQVDERECDIDSNDRNYKHIKDILPKDCHIYPMPVEAGDPGAGRYMREIESHAGKPFKLDLVHLGLGDDGHTASLVPEDPVLDVTDRDVAWTRPYQGHRRMTLTYPALNRARFVFWLVTGTEKRQALARLLSGDTGIPAGRVRAAARKVIADKDAADNTAAD